MSEDVCSVCGISRHTCEKFLWVRPKVVDKGRPALVRLLYKGGWAKDETWLRWERRSKLNRFRDERRARIVWWMDHGQITDAEARQLVAEDPR